MDGWMEQRMGLPRAYREICARYEGSLEKLPTNQTAIHMMHAYQVPGCPFVRVAWCQSELAAGTWSGRYMDARGWI